jgi:hypothetical protein
MRATEAHFLSLADSLAQLVRVVDGAGRLVYGRLAQVFVGIAGDMLTRVFDHGASVPM